MATKPQHPAPFSRFSRIGFGLSPKSNSTAARPRKNRQDGSEEEWYIPYNGPYEPPPEAPRKGRERDSWGDVVGEQPPDDDAALSTTRRKRYGVQYNTSTEDANHVTWKDGNAVGDDNRRKGSRSRSQSTVSGRTVSSGTTENSRSSTTPQIRRSATSSTQRPAASYINLDASGGVGESPMPHSRVSNSMQRSNLFAFGGQARKAPLETISRKLSRPPRSNSGLGIGYSPGPNPAKHRRNSSAGSSVIRDIQSSLGNTAPLDPHRSDDVDYYHSYYSTLISTPGPARSHHTRQPPPAKAGFTFPTPRSSHPYAQVSVKPEVHAQPDLPHLTFTNAPLSLQSSTSADAALPSSSQPFSGIKQLKNSISSPDLRAARNLPLSRTKRLPSNQSGLDRWLSPETWCDALFFPRPRLKVRQPSESGAVGSLRTVSPPGSPLPRNVYGTGIEPPDRGKGVPSRVLAHSRSLAELPKAPMPEVGPSSIPPNTGPPPGQDGVVPPQPLFTIPRPPRPKSFAQDDMSLVPSLAR